MHLFPVSLGFQQSGCGGKAEVEAPLTARADFGQTIECTPIVIVEMGTHLLQPVKVERTAAFDPSFQTLQERATPKLNGCIQRFGRRRRVGEELPEIRQINADDLRAQLQASVGFGPIGIA